MSEHNKRYWIYAISRAHKKAWEILGLKSVITGYLIIFFLGNVGILTGIIPNPTIQLINQERNLQEWVLRATIVIYLVSLFLFLILEIPKIHKEQSRSIADLKMEISKVKEDHVEIEIEFQNHKLVKGVLEIQLAELGEFDIEKLVEKERSRQLIRKSSSISKRQLLGKLVIDIVYPVKDTAIFLHEVEEYLKKYKDYIQKKHNREIAEARLLEFLPSFKNIGRKVSQDNIIKFVLSGDIRFASWEEINEYQDFKDLNPPEEPSLHEKSTIFSLGILSGIDISLPILQNIPSLSNPLDRKINAPIFESKREVSYEIRTLQPDLRITDVEPFYIWFDKLSKPKTIKIKVKIFSANLPQSTKQFLSVKVEFVKREIERYKEND